MIPIADALLKELEKGGKPEPELGTRGVLNGGGARWNGSSLRKRGGYIETRRGFMDWGETVYIAQLINIYKYQQRTCFSNFSAFHNNNNN